MPALIFDCDGVLADTERYGHLPAFNRSFSELGVPVTWSEEQYGDLLLVSGGKERLSTALSLSFLRRYGLARDETGRQDLITRLHQRKSAIYRDLVASGVLPGRPGVRRLIDEAADAGWRLAVASTSSEASVRSVLEHVVGVDRAAQFSVCAGDVVTNKKPAPDIYLQTLEVLEVDARAAVAVEDSGNGLRAAIEAGIATIVTISSYTSSDDFAGASLVVGSLGDPELAIEATTVSDPYQLLRNGVVDVQTLDNVRRLVEEDEI